MSDLKVFKAPISNEDNLSFVHSQQIQTFSRLFLIFPETVEIFELEIVLIAHCIQFLIYDSLV